MIRTETFGSIVFIDLENMRYQRFPKDEAPREFPEWSDERAGVLQDGVWHEMVAHPQVLPTYLPGTQYRLCIPVERVDDKYKVASFPIEDDEYHRLEGLLHG